jgi:N-acetylmuramoyl-L-alanine amidase
VLLPLLWLLQTAQPPARPAVTPARPSVARRAPAVAPPGALLVGVAGGAAERAVLLYEEREAGSATTYVRADQFAAASGGGLTEDAPGRWRLRIPGQVLTLREGVPFAVVGAEPDATELPLASAPMIEGERLWVPLQLLTDALPRLASEIAYDAERRALTFGRRRAGVSRPAVAAAPTAPRSEPQRDPTEPDRPPRDSSVRLPTIVGPRRSADAGASIAPAPPVGGSSLARRMVVVDAGHGGPDGGMQGPLGGGPRVREKDVTLAVALALRNSLRARGVGVTMTRTTDTLVALADRGRIANQRSGDLFISIHVNAANPSWRNPAATRGFETYFLSEAKTADDRRVADLENESIRFEGATASERDDPLSFIMRDMAQNEHLRESSELAAIVQRRLASAHPGPSRGVRQAGFRVLVSAFMPAVLVEIGFGSNPADAAWMSSARGQREIAEAVADAAVDYLRRYEQRQRGGARP